MPVITGCLPGKKPSSSRHMPSSSRHWIRRSAAPRQFRARHNVCEKAHSRAPPFGNPSLPKFHAQPHLRHWAVSVFFCPSRIKRIHARSLYFTAPAFDRAFLQELAYYIWILPILLHGFLNSFWHVSPKPLPFVCLVSLNAPIQNGALSFWGW